MQSRAGPAPRVIDVVGWLQMMVVVMPMAPAALAWSDQRPPGAPEGTDRGAGGNNNNEGPTTP